MSSGKVYAVAVGRRAGLYATWQECNAQVTGYKGALYKSFASEEAARGYLSSLGHNRVNALSSSSSSSHYSPASTHSQPPSVKLPAGRLFKSYTPARVKSAKRARTAVALSDEQLLDTRGKEASPLTATDAAVAQASTSNAADDLIAEAPEPKRSKRKSRAKDGANHFVAQEGDIEVYTDGSFKDGCGGVGVYFGEGDERNVSEPLPGEHQTSPRAELYAIIRALQLVPPVKGKRLIIHTDHLNAIGHLTLGWTRNHNHDLLNLIDDMLREREDTVIFNKVKAHCGIPGNEAVDALANRGADLNIKQRKPVRSTLRFMM